MNAADPERPSGGARNSARGGDGNGYNGGNRNTVCDLGAAENRVLCVETSVLLNMSDDKI